MIQYHIIMFKSNNKIYNMIIILSSGSASEAGFKTHINSCNEQFSLSWIGQDFFSNIPNANLAIILYIKKLLLK